MARTYYAEGRQLANGLKALFGILAFVLYFFVFPGLSLGYLIGFIIAALLIPELLGALLTRKRREAKKQRRSSTSKKSSQTAAASRKASKECRTDEVILSSNFNDMSGPEFERLLALYFRDQGYTVKEVGVGGNDGGVDLVIIDKRGEKTAVQAKCYADHNTVPVQTVRELVAAKRNHDCILSLLITTSDLTAPAKKEAEQFKVEYWHGGLIEQKLRTWGKWQPGKKQKAASKQSPSHAKLEVASSRKEAAANTSVTCICGAPMAKRRSNTGSEFWGCTKYPSCRRTKPIE